MIESSVQVKATRTGYFGIVRVEGAIFEVPLSVARRGATWFEPVESLPVEEPVKFVKQDK